MLCQCLGDGSRLGVDVVMFFFCRFVHCVLDFGVVWEYDGIKKALAVGKGCAFGSKTTVMLCCFCCASFWF